MLSNTSLRLHGGIKHDTSTSMHLSVSAAELNGLRRKIITSAKKVSSTEAKEASLSEKVKPGRKAKLSEVESVDKGKPRGRPRVNKMPSADDSKTQKDTEPQATPSPLTFMAAAVTMQDTATSILEESVKRQFRPRIDSEVAQADADAAQVEAITDADYEAEPEGPQIPQSVIDMLDVIEPKPWTVTLPPEFQPSSWEEIPYAEALESQAYWQRRRKESADIEELAWQSHHHQNERAVNRYAMVRRVAQIMSQVEAYDFMREDKSLKHIPPWARAEVIFSQEFDEFNAYVAENMAELVRQTSKEEQQEELDAVDDALFLLAGDTDSLMTREAAQKEEDDVLLDRYLDNILPGVSLSSLSEAYADEIFTAEDDDLLSFDEDIVDEAGEVGGEAAGVLSNKGP